MTRPIPTAPSWRDLCAPSMPSVEPGEPLVPLCGLDPTPPATAMLLRIADDVVLRAAFGGYAHAARMVDGTTAGRETRLAIEVWEPGVEYAVLHATRCGSASEGAAQSVTAVGDAGTGIADREATSPLRGPEVYLDGVDAVQVETGTQIGGIGRHRYLTITPGAAPAIGVHRVEMVAGFAFRPALRVVDLETL